MTTAGNRTQDIRKARQTLKQEQKSLLHVKLHSMEGTTDS